MDKEISCPKCGCVNYTLHGVTTRGQWVFRCTLNHKWKDGSTKKPFPWRDNETPPVLTDKIKYPN